MKSNQNGFSIVEIIMAVVIVGLVGVVGWLYWTNVANKPTNSKSTDTLVKSKDSASSTVEKKTQQPSASPVVGMQTYQNKALGVAFSYPSTWTLSDSPDSRYKVYINDVSKKVQSPNGFSLVFSTLSLSGYGGTGPCPEVSGFKNFGASKISNAYAIIQDDVTVKNAIIMQLSGNQNEKDANTNCMYQDMIRLREPTEDTQPYGFTFGTLGATSLPSDKDLNDAADILISTRKF